MTFTTKARLNTTAIALAAVAFTVLHGSMLMGFDQLATRGHDHSAANTQLAKAKVEAHTVTLQTVVISSRRA